jgi:hypothetical protein
VPSDPADLATPIRVSLDATPYADAVAAATDPANWTIRAQQETVIDGLAATVVEAQSANDASGTPVGIPRLIYLINVGSAGTVSLWTTGAVDNVDYEQNAGLVTLMTGLSIFQTGP